MDLEKSDFEIEGSQTTILRACETISKVQAILETSQARLEESSKRKEELVLQQGKIEHEGIVRTRAIEKSRLQLSQHLIICEDDFCC